MSKQSKKVRIFSALEVANICGVVNQTAINWIRNGHLKAFNTPGGQYRVYADDLLAFLRSRGMRVPDEIIKVVQAEQRRLLIVEDERELNDVLREFFVHKLADYEVLQAFDGFEAGMLLAEKRPEVVILDMSLPGIDGHDLIRRIKDVGEDDGPRIIAISGVGEEIDAKQRILSEGADVFFEKPFELDRLAAAVVELGEKGG